MSEIDFFSACDRLSKIVDAGQYERLRWARTEAPMIARLVELAKSTFADREEFELAEEGSGHAFRRFVVKVHGTRVFALRIELDGRTVRLGAGEVERSRYRVTDGEEAAAQYEEVDGDWMAEAIAGQFKRVSAKPDCAVTNGEAKAFPKNRSTDRKPDASANPEYRQVRPSTARANRPIS